MLDGAARVEGPGGGGRGRRPAGARHHRPRQHVRRPRLLRGLPQGRASTRSSAPRPTWPPSPATSGRCAGARSTTPAATPTAGEKLYYHLTLLAESNEGYRNLLQALVGRLPRGLLLQAPARLGAARAPPRGPHRHHRLPRAASSSRRCWPTTRSRPRCWPAGSRTSSARDNLFVEIQDHGLARAAQDQPAARRDRPPHRRAAARHQRQPLHPPRGRTSPTTPCCACRPGALIDDPKRFKFEGDGALPEVGGRDAPPLPRAARGVRQHAADRRAGQRARSSFGKPSLPQFPVPDEFTGDTYEVRAAAYLRHLSIEGAKERYGMPIPAEVHGAPRLRARRHRQHGVRRLLPRGVGPDPLRPRPRASGSARAAARPPAAASPTACRSSTSTRSSTTCCSSASSTRAASRCPTSTWTSTSATAAT